jgi:hypothetical protein
MFRKKINLFPLLFLLFLPLLSQSQIRISSPYTRYGVGELQSGRFSQNMGMAGLTAALRNSRLINPENPASYSAFDTTSFLFEAGLASNLSSISTASATQGFNGQTTLGYLLMGFPVTRWWHASLGVMPYAKTGYKVATSDTVSPTGRINQEFEGSGGINRVYVGSSFLITERLSLGANLSFLFGTTTKTRAVSFPDLTYAYNFRLNSQTIVNDVFLNYGLQYWHPFSSGLVLTTGIHGSLETSIKGRHSLVGERFTTSSTGDVYIKDTVEYLESANGTLSLPAMITAGFTLGKPGRWLAGADFGWGNWNRFDYFGMPDSSENAYRLSAAVEIIPRHSSVSGYFKKVTYRGGFRYAESNIVIHGEKLNEFALSFGAGFPIQRFRSNINLALEYGIFGKTDNNLIRENFLRITLGFNFREFWFYRRKLD